MNNKLAIYSPPFPRLKSYEAVIDFTADYGISAFEPFAMFELSEPNVEIARRVREYADEKGIIFPCFSVFATIGEDVEGMKERLKAYADVAATLGSPFLHHTIVGEHKNPDAVLSRREELLTKGIEVVREVFDYAEDKGVRTVYEDQGFIFNGVKGFGEFLERVNRNVGVVADFGNIHQSTDTIADFVNAFHEHVVHAHIKNIKFVDEPVEGSYPSLCGKHVVETEIDKGIVDCKAIIELLRSYGYDGYYGLEYAVTDDNSPLVDKAIHLADSWLG